MCKVHATPFKTQLHCCYYAYIVNTQSRHEFHSVLQLHNYFQFNATQSVEFNHGKDFSCKNQLITTAWAHERRVSSIITCIFTKVRWVEYYMKSKKDFYGKYGYENGFFGIREHSLSITRQ